MSKSTSAVVAAFVVGAAAVLGACGADEQQPAATGKSAESSAPAQTQEEKAPAEEEAVVGVIVKFHKAVDSDKGKRACKLLTKDLQGVFAENPGASDCPSGISAQRKELDGQKMADLEVAAADVEVDGKEAVVSHKKLAKRNGTDPEHTHSYNMVRKGGDWKIDYIG